MVEHIVELVEAKAAEVKRAAEAGKRRRKWDAFTVISWRVVRVRVRGT